MIPRYSYDSGYIAFGACSLDLFTALLRVARQNMLIGVGAVGEGFRNLYLQYLLNVVFVFVVFLEKRQKLALLL